ncbi:MAG: tyrosine-type recombinase/integrase [Rhodomicrobiaceae bacterium]
MILDHSSHISMSLLSDQGERKYLNQKERKRFYKALDVLKELSERTFCETIYWTGCRPSEALEMDFMRVNIEEAFLVFRSLKKHGQNKGKEFRTVPIPRNFAKLLNQVHSVIKLQKQKDADLLRRLWKFGRQKGWRLVKLVMTKAKIFGIRASARGLRHGFGIHAILSGVPETRLQKWLGHSSLGTTAVYVQAVGYEDRKLASRMW